ncbi:MAG: type II toxin-antitoxin system RelE/ParE family toxin [Firmicutes bacterium]|nr:type II toxin-antitoxin system RelE/ParE family toxin [Bacillota bacterium]
MPQNKRYKVKMSRDSAKDLSNILHYIKYKLKNPIASANLKEEIYKKIYERAYSPLSFKKYDFKEEKMHTYYTIQVNNYTVFYIIQKNTMIIARISYSRRNFEELI